MLLLQTTSWIRTNFCQRSISYVRHLSKVSGVTGEMSIGRCQAEDLHLSPVFTPGPLAVIGDEVTHFYDILTFLKYFLSKNFLIIACSQKLSG